MVRTNMRLLIVGGLLAAACGGKSEQDRSGDGDAVGDGDGDGDREPDGNGEGDGDAPVCERGETRICVGPGACAGGQVCLDDRSGWQECDCGPSGDGGAPSVGGSAATGGAHASGGAAVGGTASGGLGAVGGSATGGAPSTGGNPPIGGAGGVDGSGGSSSIVTCSGSHPATITGNYADNGTICGYAWTATFGEGETITPECDSTDGSDCFMGEICADGSIPANDPDNNVWTGVMIGWNAADSADGTTSTTWTAVGTGLTPTFTKGGTTGEVFIVIQSGGVDYCAPGVSSGSALSWSDFSVECWEGGAHSPVFSAGAPVTAILVSIWGTDSAQTFTDFCVNDITIN